MKHEWRKAEKSIYLPPQHPVQLDIPACSYFTIRGQGNPNDPAFVEYITVLYKLSYGVRMSYKWDVPPVGYYDYTVYPLEGVWGIADLAQYEQEGLNKDNLAFHLMIRQPDFVDAELAERIMARIKKKKAHPLLDQVQFEIITEGPCVQMLHIGSYDDEPASFAKMEQYCTENHYNRLSKEHREIYLSDPRKTVPEKMKTTLRFRVGLQ